MTHNYEANFGRLQQVVKELEKEALGLEESLALFEEGMKLSAICEVQLAKVEQRVQVLTNSPLDSSTKAEIPLETVAQLQFLESNNA